MKDVRKLKKRFGRFEEQRNREALGRARAEYTAAGEAPPKPALGLEKARTEKNGIDGIECGGSLTTDVEDIEEAFNDHYQALFALHTVGATTIKKEFVQINFFDYINKQNRVELVITETKVELAIYNLNRG